MSDNTGKFVWHEWMGKDVGGAVEFYRDVVGWDIAENNMAGFPYNIGSVNGYGVAGLFPTPPQAEGMPSCWTGYIWVENVEAAAAKLKAAGGHIVREPMDIPNVGRFALATDPQGAYFALFRDAGGAPPNPPPPGTPGLLGWRELHASDGAAALPWYIDQFGWKEDRQMDMGPMGVYRMFDNGGQQGGVMPKSQHGPFWLYYFLVEAADAAAARVAAKGGKVLNGPEEVPGGMWAMQCADREGAMFGLVAAKR